MDVKLKMYWKTYPVIYGGDLKEYKIKGVLTPF